MTVCYFPEEKEFQHVVCYSPLNSIVCNRQPFGHVVAEEYFEFAKMGRKRGGKEGLVDALSNAKRCFHYQVDRLLYRYALRNGTQDFNFPRKLELLSELNIIPGTLLRHFNTERNAMEHDYNSPVEETVDGSIDLCDLLFLATERFTTSTPGQMRVKFRDDSRDLIILLEPVADRLQFSEVLGTKLEDGPNGQYYGTAIFDLDGKPKEDIIVSRISNDDIKITNLSKTDWIGVLKMFSSVARDPKRFAKLPDEPMVTVIGYIPWELAKKAMYEIGA